MKNNKLLVIGAEGDLGSEFDKILADKHMDYFAPSEKDCNITNISQIREIVEYYQPDVVINCAAYNAVDEAEENLALPYSIEKISAVCHELGCRLVHYSSDYVFDGLKQDLYTETDTPNPLNVYGKSKLAGEVAVLNRNPDFLVFRLSWVIGRGKQNFLHKLSNWASANRVLKISADEVSVPTFTDDIVKLTLASLEKGLTGLYHMTNSDYASRYELTRFYANQLKLKNTIIPVAMSTFETGVSRPLFSAMSNAKLAEELDIIIPTWKESLCKFIS